MLTGILLTPVVAVLVWLYWYCLPLDASRAGRWRWTDTTLLIVLTLLAAGFVNVAMNAEYEGAGSVWPELVSAVGAYGTYAIGLAVGLYLRRRLSSRPPKQITSGARSDINRKIPR